MKDLNTLRGEIDAIDTQLVELFEQRMHCARGVAEYKIKNNLPVLDASREEQVIASRVDKLKDPKLTHATQTFFSDMMAISRAQQQDYIVKTMGEQKPVIAYSGVAGAYGDEACVGYFGEDSIRLSLSGFEAVFHAVSDGRARFGVVPLENSFSGSVTENYDLLGRYGCKIVGEYLLPVRHCLLGLAGTDLDEVKHVYSHEQGLMQCKEYLDQYAWQRMPYYNTAASAKMVSEGGDNTVVAIASSLAARAYGLEVLAEGINTKSDNFTRFVVVSAAGEVVPQADKATVAFTLRHERGTLHRALACFVALGMNLMRIESRPIQTNWQYRFYVDVVGNVSQRYMDVLLESLMADTSDCRLLGVYCAAGGLAHA